MVISLHWKGGAEARHRHLIESANRDGFLLQAVGRIHPQCAALTQPAHATLEYLATGGAMVVYKISVPLHGFEPVELIAKIPRERRIVYSSGNEHQSDADSTQILFERLAQLADHLSRLAPGLFPRCGGIWHQQLPGLPLQHALFEEFIPGLSVERLKHLYEVQHLNGQLPTSRYHAHLISIQRLAVSAYIRLWDALGRETFTSDPSPWNVLIRDTDAPAPQPTIIDLHSLEQNADLTYVMQRMAAVYGNRRAIIDEVLIPAVLEGLGEQEGIRLLRGALPALEAHAEQSRRNLGVDLQQPLLEAIRRLN